MKESLRGTKRQFIATHCFTFAEMNWKAVAKNNAMGMWTRRVDMSHIIDSSAGVYLNCSALPFLSYSTSFNHFNFIIKNDAQKSLCFLKKLKVKIELESCEKFIDASNAFQDSLLFVPAVLLMFRRVYWFQRGFGSCEISCFNFIMKFELRFLLFCRWCLLVALIARDQNERKSPKNLLAA